MTTLANYFARDVDKEPIPLIDGAYVPPVESEPESEPEYTPPRLHICSVLLAFWYIAFAAMLGASYIYVIQYPMEPADHVWQAPPLGVLVALLLWGITLALHRCARRNS